MARNDSKCYQSKRLQLYFCPIHFLSRENTFISYKRPRDAHSQFNRGSLHLVFVLVLWSVFFCIDSIAANDLLQGLTLHATGMGRLGDVAVIDRQ